MVNLSNLSENLKELMQERGLNQSALAAALNTCNSKISSYITARRAPNYTTFVSLIEYFHCSADFLLGLKEYPCEELCYSPVRPFHERLREILRETQTTQYAFIRQSGISWGVFYHWLKGTSLPSVDNLVKIAGQLDCSVDHLLGRI